jgi:hypothetical protein
MTATNYGTTADYYSMPSVLLLGDPCFCRSCPLVTGWWSVFSDHYYSLPTHWSAMLDFSQRDHGKRRLTSENSEVQITTPA